MLRACERETSYTKKVLRGVHGGHKPFNDTILVMNDLGQGGQTLR
jgi:hypothetical protein